MRTVTSVAFLSILAATGCEVGVTVDDGVKEGEDPSDDTAGLEEIPGDTDDSGEVSNLGEVSGTVQVELYTTDENGDLYWMDWEEAYGDDFPFGSIFVAAYTLDDETQLMTFHDQYVVRSPDPEGNSYSMQIDPAIAATIRVYAILDYWGDGILAPNEPIGIWPDEVPVVAGAEVTDVDITIPAPYYEFSSGSGGGGGPDGIGGGGGGDGSDSPYVTISGDALITEEYAGGSCVAILYDSAGAVPYYASSFTPTKTDGGAEGTYSLKVTPNFGTAKLMGAWDANFNGLIDPADEWGSYVDETGSLANPITVGSEDMPGYTLMIPDGSSGSAAALPFVFITGDIGYSPGFDSLGAGATVYVAALKYRPDSDITATDLVNNAYDWDVYSGADFTSASLDYSLIAPANTIVYLWAYLDDDGDGTLNEESDAIGSGGSDSSGRLATGSSSHSDMHIELATVE